MTNTVCTLFELVNGDDTEGEGACVRVCVRVCVTVTTGSRLQREIKFTRLHTSRMRTSRLLPVSPNMHCAGGGGGRGEGGWRVGNFCENTGDLDLHNLCSFNRTPLLNILGNQSATNTFKSRTSTISMEVNSCTLIDKSCYRFRYCLSVCPGWRMQMSLYRAWSCPLHPGHVQTLSLLDRDCQKAGACYSTEMLSSF